MRCVGRLHCLLISFAAMATASCGEITEPSKPVAPNFVRLESDAGDYIGGGQAYNYTQADAIVAVSASGGRLSVSVRGDQDWSGEFQSPSGLSRVQPGKYTNLQRYPFHDPAAGGLTWFGDGRGCNTLSGSFTVESVTYVGDELTAIDLRFEQRCDGATAALRGTIHWRADDTTAPPGPVNPVPTSLWRPAPGSTPNSGNYVYLKSDAGDYIGAGQTYTYTGAVITITAKGGHLSVTINGAQWWYGDFQTMSTLSQLQPGYYADLRRHPFHNPVKGGLSWYGEGRGCNTLIGWFAVDGVTYADGKLTKLDLRFEQRCEGSSSALRGAIHWSE